MRKGMNLAFEVDEHTDRPRADTGSDVDPADRASAVRSSKVRQSCGDSSN